MGVVPLDGLDPDTLQKFLFVHLAQTLASYGLYFTLNVICLHYLVRKKKINYFLVTYIILSLIASTTFVAANAKFSEAHFIPGENSAALRSTVIMIQLISYETKLCLADSLLIYRLWVIYEGAWVFISLPFVLLVGIYGSVLGGIVTLAIKDFNTTAINFGVALHSCSVAFNILATSMIVVKLWQKRKWAQKLDLDHAKVYLSTSAIFAESGALYAIVGSIYIPFIVINNPVSYFYVTWMDLAAGIAPLLILLRLAFGVAISRDTLTTLTRQTNDDQHQTKASEIGFSLPGNNVYVDMDSESSASRNEV